MHPRANLQFLELKIPPVALVLIAGLSMWVGAAIAPGFHFQFRFQAMIAVVFAFLGVVICALGLLEFKRAKTTVNPKKPQAASSLVKTGIYRYTRNPMYLGFFLMLTGWAAVTATILSLLSLAAFVLYLNRFQIQPEERTLAVIFGDEFKEYCSTVRRWI